MSDTPATSPPEDLDLEQPVEALDITQSPAFQMALAEATARISAQLVAEVKEIVASAKGNDAEPAMRDNSEAQSLARMIAASIAEMADQGTDRKRVAPEILEARAQAQKKMERLLLEVRELPKDKRPKYRLIAKFYAKDRVIDPFMRDPRSKQIIPTDIYFLGIPNQGMTPLNAAAKAVFSAYQGSISNGESEVPLGTKPIWVTDNGVIIAGTAPRTIAAHGRAIDPLDLDEEMRLTPPAVGAGDGEPDDELGFANQDDPRAAQIHVLGTIAAPAQRLAAHQKLA